MKAKLIIIIGVLALMISGANISRSQDVPKIGQTGMKWLSIPVGARGAALGAFTPMADDISAIFWNPAGTAHIKGMNFFLHQTQWIADINVNAAAISYNTRYYGVLTASALFMDWGTFNGTRRTDDAPGYIETGTFSPTSYAVGLGYAYRLSDAFSFGLHFRYVHENLGTTMEGTYANPLEYTAQMNLITFDIGTLYYVGFHDLRVGMSLQNFSNEKEYRVDSFPLPLTFKFGMAMDLVQLWNHSSPHKMTLSTEFIHPRDYSERMHVGLEYGLNNMVFLRGGYKFNYEEENLTFGAGVDAALLGSINLRLDYSYQEFKRFAGVHMFSFIFGF
jgi:opacity protein-like surface antigen